MNEHTKLLLRAIADGKQMQLGTLEDNFYEWKNIDSSKALHYVGDIIGGGLFFRVRIAPDKKRLYGRDVSGQWLYGDYNQDDTHYIDIDNNGNIVGHGKL